MSSHTTEGVTLYQATVTSLKPRTEYVFSLYAENSRPPAQGPSRSDSVTQTGSTTGRTEGWEGINGRMRKGRDGGQLGRSVSKYGRIYIVIIIVTFWSHMHNYYYVCFMFSIIFAAALKVERWYMPTRSTVCSAVLTYLGIDLKVFMGHTGHTL